MPEMAKEKEEERADESSSGLGTVRDGIVSLTNNPCQLAGIFPCITWPGSRDALSMTSRLGHLEQQRAINDPHCTLQLCQGVSTSLFFFHIALPFLFLTHQPSYSSWPGTKACASRYWPRAASRPLSSSLSPAIPTPPKLSSHHWLLASHWSTASPCRLRFLPTSY